MSLSSKISGTYLVMQTLFGVIAFLMTAGIVYAHFWRRIRLNYWLAVVIITRITAGIVPMDGEYEVNVVTEVSYAFCTFIAVDGMVYLILNVAHRGKAIAPVFIWFFAVVALIMRIISIG